MFWRWVLPVREQGSTCRYSGLVWLGLSREGLAVAGSVAVSRGGVAVESAAGGLRGRCALVLGISGPDPGLGEVELGAPAPLAEAPVQAGGLAASLAAYGYRDVLEALRKA